MQLRDEIEWMNAINFKLSIVSYQELETLQSGLKKKASLSSSDAEFIGLQVRK